MAGRPAAKIHTDNFTVIGVKDNKSGRKLWKCNHCGDDPQFTAGRSIEGRDNALLEHLRNPKSCPHTTAEVRAAARVALQAKGIIHDNPSPLLPASTGNTAEGSSPVEAQNPGVVTAVKKRKSNATLDHFVDHKLTTSQQNEADLRFFRCVLCYTLACQKCRLVLLSHYADTSSTAIAHSRQVRIHTF
jgi:hypothetical protein